MADDNAKLAACPHCGKQDAFVERSDYSACHVVCNECGARGPVRCDETEADAAASENDEAEPGELAARRAWNTRPAPPAMDREAVAKAIGVADAAFGYSCNLTRLVDGIATYTLTMAGHEPAEFDSINDAHLVIAERRNAARADAILSTLSADAIRQGEGFKWPEPKFLPVDGGAKLNPERVKAAFELINGELVIGEQFQLIEMMLDGTEYTVVPATPASHASDGGKA